MNIAFFLKGLGVVLLVVLSRANVGAQILDLEWQRKDLERCTIIDSVNNDGRGNVSVYYYDLDSLGKRVKRGHREFNDGQLYAFAWIAEDEILSVAGEIRNPGVMRHVTIRMEGFYTNILYYYENGHLSASLFFDENDLEHGWHLIFDESGKIEQKIYYEHGKEISNEVIQPEK